MQMKLFQTVASFREYGALSKSPQWPEPCMCYARSFHTTRIILVHNGACGRRYELRISGRLRLKCM
eukprot:COSAG01_NODE_405_length_17466_cov_554.403697_27_plen_65_part_01